MNHVYKDYTDTVKEYTGRATDQSINRSRSTENITQVVVSGFRSLHAHQVRRFSYANRDIHIVGRAGGGNSVGR